ncbi:helix-turn-helix domain-containing protein, partial [Acinetobacter baumannii]|nr:helix-turn-helix domain-containing protein [Acinetobacter baumannii]
MAVTLTDFGKTLRKLRIDHDVNLKNMADSLGVTSAFLSGIETGRKAISPGLINKVSEILNLSEDESTELNAAAS